MSHYERASYDWDPWESEAYLRIKRVDWRLTEIDDGDLVLDVGCGGGIDLAKYADSKSCELVGVDFSGENINRSRLIASRKRQASQVFLVLADALNLPFRPICFDKTVSYSTIDHIPKDREKSIQEMARVTKERGEVTITVPNRLNVPYYLASRILQATRREVYEYEHCFTPWELKKLMSRSGLKTIQFDSEQIEYLDPYTLSHLLGIKRTYPKLIVDLVNSTLKGLRNMEALFPWAKYFGVRMGYRGIKTSIA
jgi:ubiquinone/menaquinone biosynthesis C-methylase UbiE